MQLGYISMVPFTPILQSETSRQFGVNEPLGTSYYNVIVFTSTLSGGPVTPK